MAERKAVNKYYPPDWDPSKGSINKHNGSHHLRHRARKLNQGILVVRFAMPFNVWCDGCKNHIGLGVRYNAEKSKIGNYYDSPIYQLKVKCRLCDNYIVFKTNPSQFCYDIVSGARKQALPSRDETDNIDPDGTNQGVDLSALARAEEAKQRLNDSMRRLEQKLEDKIQSQANQPNLQTIRGWSSRYRDNFEINKLARAEFRRKRNIAQAAKERDRRLLKKASLKIALLSPSTSDIRQAREMIQNARGRCKKE